MSHVRSKGHESVSTVSWSRASSVSASYQCQHHMRVSTDSWSRASLVPASYQCQHHMRVSTDSWSRASSVSASYQCQHHMRVSTDSWSRASCETAAVSIACAPSHSPASHSISPYSFNASAQLGATLSTRSNISPAPSPAPSALVAPEPSSA